MVDCVTELSKRWFPQECTVVFQRPISYVQSTPVESSPISPVGMFGSYVKDVKYMFCDENITEFDVYYTRVNIDDLSKYGPVNIAYDSFDLDDELFRKFYLLGNWEIAVDPLAPINSNLLCFIHLLKNSGADEYSLYYKFQEQFHFSNLISIDARSVLRKSIAVIMGDPTPDEILSSIMIQSVGLGYTNILTTTVDASSRSVSIHKPKLSFGMFKNSLLVENCSGSLDDVNFPPNSDNYANTDTTLEGVCFVVMEDYIPFTVDYISGDFDGFDLRISKHVAEYFKANSGDCQQKNSTATVGLINSVFTSINPQYFNQLGSVFNSRYYTVRYTFFVPMAEPYPRWPTVLRVFRGDTWSVCALILLATGLLFRILERAEDTPQTIGGHLMNAWSILLGIGARMPNSKALRIYFLSWILFSLAINTVFQSFVTSYFFNPGLQHQIDSADELKELNYTLIFESSQTLYRFTSQRLAMNQSVYLRQKPAFILAVNTPKTALFTSDVAFTFLKSKICSDYELAYHKFSEDVMQFHIGLSLGLFPQHQRRLDKLLTRFVEMGITDKIMNDLTDPKGLKRLSKNRWDLSGEYVQMTLDYLQSPFYFWLIGLVMASAAFLCELILHLVLSATTRK